MHTQLRPAPYPYCGPDAGPPESYIGEIAWRVSNRVTHLITIARGSSLSLLPVAEHPRSGATWVGEMLADYFQIPFPKYSRFPIACPAIVHTHLWYSSHLPHAVFVKRDGRDLVISSYFHTLENNEKLFASGKRRHRHIRLYPSLRGATRSIADCRKRLPEFIRDWWSSPIGCGYNWADFTTAWTDNRPNVVVTDYESLQNDCNTEMGRVLELLTHKPADNGRLAATIAKYSFEAQTGRKPGVQDVFSNKRMGKVGDSSTNTSQNNGRNL